MYLFGGLLAFCTLGITSDLILKGRYFYWQMIVFVCFETLFVLVSFLEETCTTLEASAPVVQGYLISSI